MNLTIPPESSLYLGIGSVCLAMRPVFLALAILMVDWGRRGSNRLRVLQSSFNGKVFLRKPIDPGSTNEETKCRCPSKKERAGGSRRRNIRK